MNDAQFKIEEERFINYYSKNPTEEYKRFVIGKSGELKIAEILNAKLNEKHGSDIDIIKDTNINTRNYNFKMSKGDRAEIKSTAKPYGSRKSYLRVTNIDSKQNNCEFVIINDMRSKDRIFLIPHDVFFERAVIEDNEHTGGSFIWHEDYIPKRKSNKTNNTKLLLEHEFIFEKKVYKH